MTLQHESSNDWNWLSAVGVLANIVLNLQSWEQVKNLFYSVLFVACIALNAFPRQNVRHNSSTNSIIYFSLDIGMFNATEMLDRL